MEFGGGRKRGRPEAALNGNGGFKRSKSGSYWYSSFCIPIENKKHMLYTLFADAFMKHSGTRV